MKKLLVAVYVFFNERKVLFYSLTVAIFIILGLLASRIKVEEDISRSIPVTKQTGLITNIYNHSGFADKIVVKISLTADTTPEVLTDLADSFEERMLRNYGSYISEIKSKVNEHAVFDIYNTIHNNLPVYLEARDYKTIDSLIEPSRLDTTLRSDFKLLTSPAGLVLKRMIADDPVGISNIALKKLQTLQVNAEYDLYDDYIITRDKKNLVMFITSSNPPLETSINGKLIDGLDKTKNELNASTKLAHIDYFGGIAVAVGNARQSKKDTFLTLGLTVTILLLFIGFFFRRKRVPFIMMLPVLFGGLFSLALIAMFQRSISAIALGAGSIVLGIAINYSLHFFSHYKHCGSIKDTITDLMVPMTLGSFTTVGAFFSLVLLQSQILRDFGLFAGLSLTGATFFSLVFLPHLIPLQKENEADTHHETWFSNIPRLGHRLNAVLFVIIIAMTIYYFPKAMNVGIDSDISKLNFMTPDLKKSENNIEQLNGGDSSQTVFVASTGQTLQQAFQKNEVLLRTLDLAVQLKYITKYSSISDFIPSEKLQEQRLKIWKSYWTVDKKNRLLSELKEKGKQLKFSPTAFNGFEELLNKDYQVANDSSFAPIKEAFGNDYLISAEGIKAVVNTLMVVEPERSKLYALLDRNAATVILDKKLITNKLIDLIYNDFNNILAYSSLLVLFALWFSYCRLELTIMTFLPMFISYIWILGVMDVFGISFNIINIIISTFIFGIGDDFSIFITDGLTRKFSEGKETIASHKVSIFLSATTTIIGLGALIFAKHPAMHSIAVISIIGITCVVLIGQTIQPFMYNFLVQNRKERGLAPWTFLALLISSFAFIFFVTGAILLTIFGLIFIYLFPFPKKKTRKLVFHYLLWGHLNGLVYVMINTRKVHINKGLMDYSKPAIIIANHQSFLDILMIVKENPKLIMLTNQWTYHSPFFGKVIQMADYYPIMEGVNPGIEKFADIVKDGYSIVIFPEGTRSVDRKVHRFHKGAFYLAEKLNMDIVPVLLHGTGDTMGKGDFMLYNGRVTLKYLPRITPDNKEYGDNYAERTKYISRYFKAEYNKLRAEIEVPRYFRQRMVLNYIYKGTFLEFYTRIKLKREKYYADIDNLIPKQGTVTVLGSNYGFMCYMLHFVGTDRKIYGFDRNEEKVDMGNNCFSKNKKLQFVQGNVLHCELPVSDVFIIDNLLQNFSDSEITDLFKRLSDRLSDEGSIIVKNNHDINNLKQLKNISETLKLDFRQVSDTILFICFNKK